MNEQYIISTIEPKNGEHNSYHDEMRESFAYIVTSEVGERAIIRYRPQHDDGYHCVRTSTVQRVLTIGDDELIIETNNTVYTFVKSSIQTIILDAEFTSVWDGGFAVTTKCRVNETTKEVFNIEVSEDTADMVNELKEEYITIDGKRFPVVSDEYLKLDPEESGGYWYQS